MNSRTTNHTFAFLLILLSAVCANAEWKFDNDKEVQERGDKRDEEREEARKALERVRFGVKVGGFLGSVGDFHASTDDIPEIGIMINTPLSRIKDGNLVLATELNYGERRMKDAKYGQSGRKYNEDYLNIPLMFQYVSFWFPASAIQVHWVQSPKRYWYMHFKTIMEAGAFIDIPFGTTINDGYDPANCVVNGSVIDCDSKKDYKDRNFFDLGGMVGYAAQLENIILGLRLAASYTDIGGSSLLLQGKLYFGYLF